MPRKALEPIRFLQRQHQEEEEEEEEEESRDSGWLGEQTRYIYTDAALTASAPFVL